jgi:hypothetical protein
LLSCVLDRQHALRTIAQKAGSTADSCVAEEAPH